MPPDPVDHGQLAHAAAVAHIEACMAALDEEGEAEGAEVGEVEWPAELAAPFCGCTDCWVREILTAAWPHVLAAARAELAAEERAPA